MKMRLLVLLSVWFGISLLATSVSAGTVYLGPLPPSITVSAAVGTNPSTVYTSGQTQRTVDVTWNAGSDYPYCEIYYTVNSANQTELGRGHDGVKSFTFTAGNTYAFWMIVYLGAQGQDVRTVTELRVVGIQGNPPSSSSSPSGGGEVVRVDPIGVKDAANRYALAINNVRVSASAHDIMIKFHGPPDQVPYVAIGRAAPIMKNSEWVFGDNLVGGGFVAATVSAAEKAKGEYTFASAWGTTFSEDRLDPERTYYYVITIPARGRQSYQATGSFTMDRGTQTDASLPLLGGEGGGFFSARCPQGQLLTGFELRTGDDVDAIRPICVVAYGRAEVGRLELYPSKFGGDGGSARQLVCPHESPIVVGMYILSEGLRTPTVNNIRLWCGLAGATQKLSLNPNAAFDGPRSRRKRFDPLIIWDEATQYCPDTLVAVGINGRSGVWLDAVGLICGPPKLTPVSTRPDSSGNSENTGTTTSPLKTTPSTSEPVKGIGRVRQSTTTQESQRPICDVAREARARNSPAAPGLEAQCRASAPPREDAVVSIESKSATRGSAVLITPVNNGASFQLICRGGPGLRVSNRTVQVSGGLFGPGYRDDWSIAFLHSTQPPDASGRNLQPGQCSPTTFSLSTVNPTDIQTRIEDNGSLRGVVLYPWEKQNRNLRWMPESGLQSSSNI